MEEKVLSIIQALKEAYPEPVCALHYERDYQLLIAVRLAAQCTDERVNQVTPALFERFPSLEAFAEADVAELPPRPVVRPFPWRTIRKRCLAGYETPFLLRAILQRALFSAAPNIFSFSGTFRIILLSGIIERKTQC